MTRRIILWTMVAGLLGGSLSCDVAPPPVEDMFNRFGTVTTGPDALLNGPDDTQEPLDLGGGGTTLSNATLEQEVISVIESARFSVQAAFEHLENRNVAQALINAHQRGVDVKVVGDVDHRGQIGFQMIDEAGVPASFGDGELTYNPELIDLIHRTGDMNRMTHNFVIADGLRVYNLTAGFPATDEPLTQLGFDAISEDLGKDFGDEFTQMFGGMYATTLSTFNGPLKSDSNNRTHYPNDLGDLEVYFGPQERLTKRIIDEIYNARASVFIVTESLNNKFIADALRYKATAGFEVGIVVERANADSPFSRVEDLSNFFDQQRQGGAHLPDLRLADGVGLNMIIIDAQPSPIDGRRYRTKVMVMSQPLLESIAFAATGQPTPRAADPFSDSNMWVLNRVVGLPEPNVARFIKVFEFLFNQ